jgi:hypothetical protein
MEIRCSLICTRVVLFGLLYQGGRDEVGVGKTLKLLSNFVGKNFWISVFGHE